MFQNYESIWDRLGRWVLTMMRFALVIMLCITLGFTLSIEPASAVCCNPDKGKCANGELELFCCGRGKCNVFCCNCDGGCKTQQGAVVDENNAATTAPSNFLSSKEYFESIDTDRYGTISVNEFNVWASRPNKCFSSEKTPSEEFVKIDTNNNGSIEFAEFDSDLGKIPS
jgi:hypothetical protein